MVEAKEGAGISPLPTVVYSTNFCGMSRIFDAIISYYNGCGPSLDINCHGCGTSLVSNHVSSTHYDDCGTGVASNNACYVCPRCNLLTSAAIASNSRTYSFAITTDRGLQSPQTEALRLIQRAAAGWVGSQQVDEWRSDLLRTFQAWEKADEEISQRHFWRILDTLEVFAPAKFSALDTVYITLGEAEQIANARCDVTPWNSYYDLSPQRIRSILCGVVGQLEELDPTECAATVLSYLDDALKRGVVTVAVRRHRSTNVDAARSAPSTHDWVLDFAIHTGNSPPALADRRPAVGRAPVSLKAPRTVDHETVSRRENSKNLRNEICTRNTRVRLNRRSQGHPQVGRRVRHAGRRDHRPHCSLAQYA